MDSVTAVTLSSSLREGPTTHTEPFNSLSEKMHGRYFYAFGPCHYQPSSDWTTLLASVNVFDTFWVLYACSFIVSL